MSTVLAAAREVTAAARSLLGERVALKGNLDTTLLLRGSAQEELRAEV